MGLQIATIAASIAGLTIAGVTIKDLDEIPTSVGTRESVLTPAGNFISDFSMERDSFGGGSTAKMTVEYILTYRFFYAPVGGHRNPTIEWIPGLVSKVSAIWDAFLEIDTLAGCVDIVPLPISGLERTVLDAADAEYYGCDLSFRVTEFVN
jgi:hypothetical protein